LPQRPAHPVSVDEEETYLFRAVATPDKLWALSGAPGVIEPTCGRNEVVS